MGASKTAPEPIDGGTSEGYNGDMLSFGESTDVAGNRNVAIPDMSDFKEENIAEDKPLICIWPAHSKSSGKGAEYYWSSKLIDEYIIPKLKNYKFYDETSYADNIHRANKSGSYTGNEVRKIIERYGSKNVISIVPHWNAARGDFFIAFRGKRLCDDRDSEINCRNPEMREDSYIFGSIFDEEVKKVAERAKNNEFLTLPNGMMKRATVGNNSDLKYLLPYTAEGAASMDPAVNLNCACILTENFFVDFGAEQANSPFIAGPYENIEKYKDKYTEKEMNNVRFKYGQGWLLSDEGMTVISDYHVEAIRRYINNLHNGIYGMTTAGNIATKPDDEIYAECANMIGCELAAFKALKEVETGSMNAFIAPGKPSILFEGHIFWQRLQKRGKNPKDYVNGNSDILYPSWTKSHYVGGIKEYDRLEKAKAIDEVAALESASWGLFQVMGFNYAACGYSNVKDFVSALSTSADDQIRAAAKFVCSNSKLKNALISKDWAKVALYYNGPKYAENKYDVKLRNAYNRIVSQS